MPIRSGADYIQSLRGRNLRVFSLGERVLEPVDHPLIRPSIDAVARTYDLALEDPALATVRSSLTGVTVNRFLHVAESKDDVVMQNRMQRRLGQLTGTCFQRCVGMDAINALWTTTFEFGEALHDRFKAFVAYVQADNLVVGGAIGVVIRGAKAHQTGCLNSHWALVMPTMRLGPADKDYAIVAAIPVDHPGLLTESMRGAGSPQAQRIQIQRLMGIEEKKRLAQDLAAPVELTR